jgi:molybdenum cofactor guanylyltransferase
MHKGIQKYQITGLILSGGRGTRMEGQDKGLVEFMGEPLVSYSIKAIQPLVSKVLISANRHFDRYRDLSETVLSDLTDGFQGPLAGLYTGFCASDRPYLLTVPCDCPFVTPRLLERLSETLVSTDADLVVAGDGNRLHPVFQLGRKEALIADLGEYLNSGERKVMDWVRRQKFAIADFSDAKESLQNVNTLAQLHTLEAHWS